MKGRKEEMKEGRKEGRKEQRKEGIIQMYIRKEGRKYKNVEGRMKKDPLEGVNIMAVEYIHCRKEGRVEERKEERKEGRQYTNVHKGGRKEG